VTKNGTNQFHGGLYYYFRNEDLKANAYFNKYFNNQARPRYRFNTAGGTLGGPVYWPGHFNRNRDRLPRPELAALFADALDAFRKDPHAVGRQYIVNTSLVIRESTGPARPLRRLHVRR
jgi:hypothetical protein